MIQEHVRPSVLLRLRQLAIAALTTIIMGFSKLKRHLQAKR